MDVLERLRTYVVCESPSGDEARATKLARLIAGDLAAVGAEAETIAAPGWGEHVQASVAGTDAAREPVLILGHLDTVHPVGTLDVSPFRVEDGRAEGPGVFDMKAGLAVMVESLGRLQAAGVRPHRPVRILITCDEEVGSGTSRPLIEEAARDASAVLVLEPPLPSGAAKTARKGVGTYRLRVSGRAAHAGVEPERGVSAVSELVHQLRQVLQLAQPDAGTTVNIGVVHGGTASNVVAEEAWADLDIRYATALEGERVHNALQRLRARSEGARVALEIRDRRPPLERTEGVARLYHQARTLAGQLGFELGEGATGGGSDGCFTNALGTPTLDGLGVNGGGAHARDEHIFVDDLPRRVALLERLLATL